MILGLILITNSMSPGISNPKTPNQSLKWKRQVSNVFQIAKLNDSDMETTPEQYIHVIQMEKLDIEPIIPIFKDIEVLILKKRFQYGEIYEENS
jgi:hypothetical protein